MNCRYFLDLQYSIQSYSHGGLGRVKSCRIKELIIYMNERERERRDLVQIFTQ